MTAAQEAMADKIYDALLERWLNAPDANSNEFTLTMKKSGHKVYVKNVHGKPSRSGGRWHGNYGHIEVWGDGIDGVKCFKGFKTLAKAIACGIID